MKTIRILLSSLLVLSAAWLVGALADTQLSGAEHRLAVAIALQSMHALLPVCTVLYAVVLHRQRATAAFVLTLLPAALLALAFVLNLWGSRFSSPWLLAFDFYQIIWFSVLTDREMRPASRAVSQQSFKTLPNIKDETRCLSSENIFLS